jgi:hypothetical protein
LTIPPLPLYNPYVVVKGVSNMIDQFNVKTKTKILIVKNDGLITRVGEYQGEGKKPKLIDIAIGDFIGIVEDLRGAGYEVRII